MVKDYGAVPHLIIPYFAYGRQDKRFQPGEAFSLKAIATMLKALGVEGIITVDAHFQRSVGRYDFFSLKAKNISAVELLFEHAAELMDNFVVVGPDKGSENFLKLIKGEKIFLSKEKYCPDCKMEAINCKCKSKEKRYEIRIKAPESVKGRNVLLMDDMIASGGTIIEAARALRKAGAGKIAIACVHGLFLNDAMERIKRVADFIFTANTIENAVSEVDISPLIADTIRHRGV